MEEFDYLINTFMNPFSDNVDDFEIDDIQVQKDLKYQFILIQSLQLIYRFSDMMSLEY